MMSYCCIDCGSYELKYTKYLDCFYCYVCENYTDARVKRWD